MSTSISYVFRIPAPILHTALTPEQTKDVPALHQTIPGYQPTPICSLDTLAKDIGLGRIFVKDESRRFGLNAFKALGGSYAIAREIAQRLGLEEVSFSSITAPEVREQVAKMTFVTATDGNHGRGVAWTARLLGASSIVLMPKGSASERLENIRKEGAKSWITECNYDDTVRMAMEIAEKENGVLIQDTAWDGYQDIPLNIMKGYTTMGHELLQQLPEAPTHIFLQAGVGTMAGAMTGFLRSCYPEAMVTILEPNNAACIYESARHNDGKAHFVTGELRTIMAGLACGEPCTLAWDILRDGASCFVSLPEWVTAEGMRILANPRGDDPTVISGESGAVSTGFVYTLMTDPRFSELKEKLGLNKTSRVLCLSTEGATDRENYRKIVAEGAYPKE